MKRQYQKKSAHRGAALLVVLFIVMTITVLSLGFLSRTDTELACGQNTILHQKMDALAYSGLAQAKGLLLYPQDSAAIAAGGYWTGANSQQLESGDDYYDVWVAMHTTADADPSYRCTYDVNSEAYRLKNGVKTARSSIAAQLRFDECIAYRTQVSGSIPQRMTINGDVYCGGNLLNGGVINGDVFANALSGGSATGQTKAAGTTTVSWPNVTLADFTSRYSVQSLPAAISGVQYGPYTPAKVCYYNGTLTMNGGAVIEGMLVVNGDLYVGNTGIDRIAGKNLPALYVTGDVVIQDAAELTVNGLAVVENRIRVRPSSGNVNIYGGLFVRNGIVETMQDSSGFGNTEFLYNCPTWRPTGGQVNGALEFDGVDDYLQTANSSSTLQISNDYTASVWVKADASQKSWAAIFSRTDPGGNTNHWTLQFDSSSPKHLVMYHPSGYWNTGITLTNIAGAWHNIRIVRSGTTMKSYLDGVLKLTETFSYSPASGNGHLNIGVDRTGTSSYTYKGLIDELAIYNQAATGANDIPAGLIGSWNFDKSGSGTINVNAMPNKAAVIVWNSGTAARWGQAGGAFFRTIRRN